MPIPLKPLDKVIEKWKNRATAASADFAAGVQSPLKDWKTQALAAAPAWRDAITQAAGRDAYKTGVAAKDTAFWQKRAIELGAPRYSDGVAKSVDVYKNEFAPFYDALSKIELPPRGARGDPKNLERVRVITETLRKVKLGSK